MREWSEKGSNKLDFLDDMLNATSGAEKEKWANKKRALLEENDEIPFRETMAIATPDPSPDANADEEEDADEKKDGCMKIIAVLVAAGVSAPVIEQIVSLLQQYISQT